MDLKLVFNLPLPTELNHYIAGFILRPDWKTCRKHESGLIRQNCTDTAVRLEDPTYESVIEISSWTLYGKLFIIKWLNVLLNGRGINLTYKDRYTNWYTQKYLHWVVRSYNNYHGFQGFIIFV